MKKFLSFSLVFFIFSFLFLILKLPVRAISPSGVRQIPDIPFVNGDCSNQDWGTIHPEWGTVGGYWDFSTGGHCYEGGSGPVEYIQKAKTINKPVGVGIRFKNQNDVIEWAGKLLDESGNPKFDNLAFIVAPADSSICQYGETTAGCVNWAKGIFPIVAEKFSKITVIFLGTVNTLGDMGNEIVTKGYKNIGLKCNGWDIDLKNAQTTINGTLAGGSMRFADVYNDKFVVGYEPRHGLSTEEWYWGLADALSHHPDILDISSPELDHMAAFEGKYGFPQMKFIRDNLGKTITTAPDFWTVLRTTHSSCENNVCCFDYTSGGRNCTEPQRSNYSYWLYQNDNIAGGKTVAFTTKENPLVPNLAKSHPYGLYETRRTNESSNNPYMYFDIDDSYRPPADKNTWEITVTFVNNDDNTPPDDTLSLEYKDERGNLVTKTITKGAVLGTVDQWVDYKWTLTDADSVDFSNNKFEGKADFRINSNGDGDEIIHRVIVGPPTGGSALTGVPSPTATGPQPTTSPTPISKVSASPPDFFLFPLNLNLELKLLFLGALGGIILLLQI